MLRRWIRTSQPIGTGARDSTVLAACLDLAGFRKPIYQWGDSRSVDERRALLASTTRDGDTLGNDTEQLTMPPPGQTTGPDVGHSSGRSWRVVAST